MSTVAISAYRNTSVAVVSPARMVAMGFDGLLEYLHRAERAFAENNSTARVAALDPAVRIVEQLLTALDPESKAEAMPNLRDLYVFLLDRMARANIHSDPALLAECRPVVENLREAWTKVADNAEGL